MSTPPRNPDKAPIFILGISQRSGTNYLNNLMLQHPDCAAPQAPIKEDYLLANARPLFDYVDDLCGTWRNWGDTGDMGHELSQYLGDSLVRFLESGIDQEKRLVSKTPSIKNLRSFDSSWTVALY